ncbi:MAG TPA: right-handed parallel beta-helix repeat-containing protein [Opitutus sp.]|nr:right-handed parallel beta-helix repeat-containing protein [Opitutus sp.]
MKPTSPARSAAAILFSVLAAAGAPAAVIPVADGDNLQAKIDAAQGGDVLLLATGTYHGFKFADRHFTAEAPLVVKAAPGAHPVIHGASYDEDHLAEISRSSYVVLDGLELTGGNRPIYCQDVDHFIFINLTIHDTGQEAIHIRGTSRYVDVRDCRLFDTGHKHSQWSEGVYIGQGSGPFENTEHVWIEGNDIHRTGNSEGINIKPRSYHVTIRGNKVHDIAPGTDTQYNESAISCEAADLAFKPGVDPDIWIEGNEIFRVAYGRWANGIQPTTMGPRVVRNRIHDCQQYGIEFNDYLSGPGMFTTILWQNVIEDCRDGAFNATELPHEFKDPGPNPNQPQAWYATPTRAD